MNIIKSTAFNQRTAGIINRRSVMQLLLRHQQLSRRQMAQLLNLKDATLSYITAELLERDLIRMAGKSGKHVMVEINPNAGWSLGVELAQGWIALNFVTANGDSIHRAMMPFSNNLDALPAVLESQIDLFCTTQHHDLKQLLAIGVSICGIVDTSNGEVLLSNYYRAKNYPLQEILSTKFNTIVTVDNSTNCAAIGETLCNNDRNLNTFLHCDLLIDRSQPALVLNAYGLSLFINGDIYRGSHFAAGELISFKAPNSPDSVLLSKEAIRVLQDEMGPNAPICKEVAYWLNARLAPLVSFMDPTHVIIGGDYHCSNQHMLKELETMLNETLYQISNRRIHVISSNLGAYGLSQYAAFNALNTYNEILFPLD